MLLTPLTCNRAVSLTRRAAYITRILAEGRNVQVLGEYVLELHEIQMETYRILASILPEEGIHTAPDGFWRRLWWRVRLLRHLFLFAKVVRAAPGLLDVHARLLALDGRFEL